MDVHLRRGAWAWGWLAGRTVGWPAVRGMSHCLLGWRCWLPCCEASRLSSSWPASCACAFVSTVLSSWGCWPAAPAAAVQKRRGATKNGELEVFYADTPLGPWRAHAANPVMNGDRRAGARMAGRVVPHDGKLLRFGQDCGATYGHKVGQGGAQLGPSMALLSGGAAAGGRGTPAPGLAHLALHAQQPGQVQPWRGHGWRESLASAAGEVPAGGGVPH